MGLELIDDNGCAIKNLKKRSLQIKADDSTFSYR